MKKIFNVLLAVSLVVFIAAESFSAEKKNENKTDKKANFVSLVANFELGFLAVAEHKIQFGDPGTYIDYVKDGGQDVLFPAMRFSIDLILAQYHRISFLYQPLELVTTTTLARNLTIDGKNFAANTDVEFRYSFPFYRLSYAYDVIKGSKHVVALGASIQIRNADISFRALDGSEFVRRSNIGPVPVLKFYWKTKFDNGWWIGSEIDGFYAPISILNGSTNEVVGAIVDASLRGGFTLNDWSEIFLNVRYLGGGAIGSSNEGYNKNWLHFITVTMGFTLRLI